MKAGIYLGKEQVEIQELPLPEVGDNDVLVQNLYSSVCGTDVAVFSHGPTTDIDCWLDAAGAESILDDFLNFGKIESRFVSVAVNNKPRNIDLLHMTYAQQMIIGSGGYMPEDVRDVQEIMSCGKWNLEQIITHEYSLDELEQAIRMAGDVNHAGNVVVKIKNEI